MRKKTNYDKKYKVMRVRAGDYAFVAEVSRKAGVSMAEALHLVILQKDQATNVSPQQIPMPAFRVASISAIRVASIPAIRVEPVTTMATNGSKGAAFVIKPKGVRHD